MCAIKWIAGEWCVECGLIGRSDMLGAMLGACMV